MPPRGKYLLRKYSRRSFLKRKKLKNMEGFVINILAVIVLITMGVFVQNSFFTETTRKINVEVDNVSAFQIPYKSLTILKNLSAKYKIDYIELLTIYSLENSFFKDKGTTSAAEEIEQKYILDYDTLKKLYTDKKIKPYYNMFKNLFDEIEYFPIPTEFDKEDSSSYMFGDSWGSQRNYGGERIHEGTDILDRENIRGRIPIVSMTDGTIENIGWNELGGFRIGIRTINNTYYYYAHMDRFANNLQKDTKVKAGQLIGYMGDTGYSKKEGTKGNFQVHLHVGISPDVSFTNKEFWINPYTFLRYIENTRIPYVAE